MQGLGDNILQRALVRQWLKLERPTYLLTPWPALYHDFSQLRLVHAHSVLRTQAKNEKREASKYWPNRVPVARDAIRIWYNHASIRRNGSILGAMLRDVCLEPWDYNFTLPIPDAWCKMLAPLIKYVGQRKILIYRPLVVRKEWIGCEARNPDPLAYHKLFQSIRDRYFVISIADLVPGFEWVVSKPIKADLEFHRGELSIEMMAALFQKASVVYTSPGFATHLAQAVHTPLIAIFGGHESSMMISLGAHISPTLAIDPINPCNCYRKDHNCDKAIDVEQALQRIDAFVADGDARVFEHSAHQLDRSHDTVHESRGA